MTIVVSLVSGKEGPDSSLAQVCWPVFAALSRGHDDDGVCQDHAVLVVDSTLDITDQQVSTRTMVGKVKECLHDTMPSFQPVLELNF